MKVYQHKSKKKYYFIQNQNFCKEYIFIEKKKRKIEMDSFFDNAEVVAFEKKIQKKGYLLIELPAEVIQQTNALMQNFELSKEYYFIEKNEKAILHSNLVSLKLDKSKDNGYALDRISSYYENDNEDIILASLQDYSNGYLATEKEELNPGDAEYVLSFYLNMLLLLGFELQNEEALVNLQIKNPITETTDFTGNFYKEKGSDYFYKIAPNYDIPCIQFTKYKVKNGLITSRTISYTLDDMPMLKSIMDANQKHTGFEKPMSEEEFFSSYKFKEEKEVFKAPVKTEFNLPFFPIYAPEVLEIKDFFDHNIEENKYYFFANTEEENPLEWQVSYITCADEKEKWYQYAKPFLLKDLNKALSKPKEIELNYSSDKREFAKSQEKKYKKIGLKAISADAIYKAFTGKTIEELNQQTKNKTFVIQDDFASVATVFDTYVCLRDTTVNHVTWQFFINPSDTEKWMQKHETTVTELYDYEVASLLKHTQSYLDRNDVHTIAKLKGYKENPALSNYFSRKYDLANFEKSELTHKDGFISKEDYVYNSQEKKYTDYETTIITGDVTVDGTLFFNKNKNTFIIIEGNLKAKNLIISSDIQFLYVTGSIAVSNITNATRVTICENAKTHVLLHKEVEVKEIANNYSISYDHEVAIHSTAITNKKVLRENSYKELRWNIEAIADSLFNNEPFLKDNLENAKTDLDEYYKNKFEKRMQNWGYFYPEYAGCEHLSIGEDNEIKGNAIYPGSGDWVVNDIRGQSGTYGVSHEDYSIYKLKVKKPEDFNIDYKQKPLKLVVNAEELMTRYQWLSMLYMDWEHRKTVALSPENDQTITNKAYEAEKLVFAEDPHLALYWLNHFGTTLDHRYKEVVASIEKHQLIEKLDILKEPLAFFKKTDALYSFTIKKNTELFLIRRAYLVYIEQSYKNYNPENVDLWWKSVTIFPKVEENLIVRMRWLKNNLKKCNSWSNFDKLIQEKEKNIPLLSYVLACNPNTSAKDKTKYSNLLVSELLENKEVWSSTHKMNFAQIILWDVHLFVTDKKVLKEAANFYFFKSESTTEYKDIANFLGGNKNNNSEINTAIDLLNKTLEGYSKDSLEKEKYHIKVTEVLSSFTPELLFKVVGQIRNHDIAKRCFVYLWKSNLNEKKNPLVTLFTYLGNTLHEIKEELIDEKSSNIITNENDPHIDIVLAFYTIPEADFRDQNMFLAAKLTALNLFWGVAHYPKVFQLLISAIKQAPTENNKKIMDTIYTSIFSQDYDTKINSTLKFSKDQIETMLETICQWFLDYGYHAEGYRSIYYCTNPMAKEWLTQKLNDTKWLKQFTGIKTFYDPLDEELKDAFVSALEFIRDEEQKVYLEFNGEDSRKFWKIDFYGEAFIVTYGKVGTEGRTSEKNFDSIDLCHKAGQKLINQKLKKGYIKKKND